MCGVVGVFGHPEAANLTYLGLHALQHRGQEAAGITSGDGDVLHTHTSTGHVVDTVTGDVLSRLPGALAIGHVRYSTAGGSGLRNAQPMVAEYEGGSLAVAHNGNLTNHAELRTGLGAWGAVFRSSVDTEVILHLVAAAGTGTGGYAPRGPIPVEQRLRTALPRLRGAWSLLFATPTAVYAARDPHGFRPLCIGRMDVPGGGTAWVFASESCALELIGATYERDVAPGELVIADADGLRSERLPVPPDLVGVGERACIFEFVYFARPDARIFGSPVYPVRRALGRELAREHPADADVVVPVPDSGVLAALGYAEESGQRFELGLTRNHYVGRTFIEPSQSIRNFGVKLKLSPVREVLAGKRVVIVDDSIVRGTTSRKIVAMVRAAGAAEVHLRVSSPPTRHPCFYGIDTPTKGELVADRLDTRAIADFVGADTLGYLSVEGLHRAVRSVPEAARRTYCDACFTGNYPV